MGSDLARRRGCASVVAALTVAALVPGAAPAGAADGGIALVSTSAGGVQGDDESTDVSLSADGRFVAFGSAASNLVAADRNGDEDVFVRDRFGGTERVSVATGGGEGNGRSYRPSMSADGRWVAYVSEAANLVQGDTNGVKDVFVRDRAAGTTSRVSVATGGRQGNGASFDAAISADGRVVAFASLARNLVGPDGNGAHDIFLHDRATGVTTRVTNAVAGGEPNRESEKPVLSADGRFVAYASAASNLVPGDRNGVRDIFVHDRATGTTTRVSVGAGGEGNAETGFVPAISADARLVAFMSAASNLVPGDRNGVRDIFVHDRATGSTRRVSVATGGREGNDDAFYGPAISADGRRVAFVSEARSLVEGDTNGARDVFVHDLGSGATTRVNVSTSGRQANGPTLSAPALSANGAVVAFHSRASNLVPGDGNGTGDVYVRGAGVFPTATIAPGQTPDGGYRLVAADGGIFSFGDASFHGSTGAIALARPIVGSASTPSGRGYWLVAADGGIFSFGDARFHGSTGAMRLNRPIVGMAPTPSGRGYWLVASDGGIFSFGDARFRGSTGAIALVSPIVALAATDDGRGYWLVAADGGIFNFGNAAFLGSAGAAPLPHRVVGMAVTRSGDGYWLATAGGAVLGFGDAAFLGALGSMPARPIVGISARR